VVPDRCAGARLLLVQLDIHRQAADEKHLRVLPHALLRRQRGSAGRTGPLCYHGGAQQRAASGRGGERNHGGAGGRRACAWAMSASSSQANSQALVSSLRVTRMGRWLDTNMTLRGRRPG